MDPTMLMKTLTVADVVEPAISGDPLLRNVDLPLRRIFHPLGFSIELKTNSPKVMAAAEECWGGLLELFAEPRVELLVAATEGGSGICPPAPAYRAQRNLLSVVANAQNFAVCDRDHGFAFAWIDADAMNHPDYLRFHFLESIAYNLLSSFYVTPLHAACVEFAGKGVLLCGNSGAGKSSLAFACARAGWKYISDDACYLVRRNADRLTVGNARHFRLRLSARELFPELTEFLPGRWTAGKPSIEIPISRFPHIATAKQTTVEYILFLNRAASAPPELIPFPADVAQHWAAQSSIAMGDEDGDERASMRNLLEARLFELRYSHLEETVSFLETLISRDGSLRDLR
jgi:HPr Serine kinase C-terminal domain